MHGGISIPRCIRHPPSSVLGILSSGKTMKKKSYGKRYCGAFTVPQDRRIVCSLVNIDQFPWATPAECQGEAEDPPPLSLFPVPNPIHHGSVWGDVQLPQRQKNGRPLFTPRPCQKALNVFWESRFHFDPSCAAAGSEETSEEKPHFLYRRTNPAMKWTGVISIP